MTTGRQIVLSALTTLAVIVYLGKPADAAPCGNSPAGFEAWKQEFGEEAKAKGVGATGVAGLMQANYASATIAADRGIPMVAIPVANDQHGVGARIQFTGCGQVVPLAEVSAERLRQAIYAVLSENSYRESSRQLAAAIRKTDGLNHAARLIASIFTDV